MINELTTFKRAARAARLVLAVLAMTLGTVLVQPTEASAQTLLAFSTWESLGGKVNGAVAATTWGPSRLDLFARGAGNDLVHKWWVAGWSGWESLGSPPGGLASAPAAVAWAAGRIDVFVDGADSQLWHKWWAGGWSGWESLGGWVTSTPTVTTWGAGRLDVFVRGADNTLQHLYWAAGWSSWESLGASPGGLVSAPGGVSWGSGRIDVFVQGTDNQLWHKWWAGGWSDWEGLGGVLSSAPAAASWGPGRLDVVVRGPANVVYHRSWEGGWSNFQQAVAGASSSPPGAVSWGFGRLDVLAQAGDGSVLHSVGGPAAGFFDVQLQNSSANPLSSPTAIVSLDGSRALVLEKAGAVRILQADGTLADSDALTLNVCTVSEAGLMGAAVDPQFATNGYIYLYYARNAGNCASSTGRFNRVSRFVIAGNTIDPNSELVLLDNMNIPAGNHNGGDLEVGHDGYLYVSVGDGGVNPRGGATSAAQDLSLLNGKILRITRTGGVPSDNPFVGLPNAASCANAGVSTSTSTRCTEIFAYGLRNPFRFAFDPNTAATRFFINDVGQNTWEEVDDGGKGLNYGWNMREGFCSNGSTTDCTPPGGGLTDPLTAYGHSIGCSYITAAAFVPNGVWPAAYDGSYLFGDGGCGKVFRRTSTGSVDYGVPFAATSGVIVDMAFLTQGGRTALYYVTNSSSQIHKIVFQ
jgi:glucose/arabinose dehydrogenase